MKIGDRIVVYPHITCQRCNICMTYGNGNCSCENDWIYGGTMMDVSDKLNHDPDVYPHFKVDLESMYTFSPIPLFGRYLMKCLQRLLLFWIPWLLLCVQLNKQ